MLLYQGGGRWGYGSHSGGRCFSSILLVAAMCLGINAVACIQGITHHCNQGRRCRHGEGWGIAFTPGGSDVL
jgi:hypothetical protein